MPLATSTVPSRPRGDGSCLPDVAAAYSLGALSLLMLACAPGGDGAGDPPANEPLPNTLAEVVVRDEAFASAARSDVSNAFRTFVSPEGILFQPGPVQAGPWLAENEVPVSALEWVPVAAGLASSGDLGYTTGPYLATGADGRQGRGHYVSVWRKVPGSDFMAVLDIGVPTGESGPLPQGAPVEDLYGNGTSTPGGDGGEPTELENVLAVDRAFAVAQATDGTLAAMPAYAAPSLRLYRAGRPPLIGPTEEEASAALVDDRPSTSPTDGGIAASGTLGYVYGSVAQGGRADAGSYLRIWRRDPGGPWTLALELVSLPPPGP